MLKTEMRNPKTMNLDQMDTLAMVRIMNEENMNAVKAVEAVSGEIARAIDVISLKMKDGGRLFYMGAGTSGRLGVIDAAECPPTFGVSPEKVVGIIAGGDKCLKQASENAEDSAEAGKRDLEGYELTGNDVVVGLSVAGGAAYVLSGLSYAKSRGCVTVGITSNEDSPLAEQADIAICPDTGAEVVTGSTRLKAGTAQKLILNMLSTCAMVKQGYVCENLMINLKPSNDKLKKRVIRITTDLTGLNEEAAVEALEKNGWSIRKVAEEYKRGM